MTEHTLHICYLRGDHATLLGRHRLVPLTVDGQPAHAAASVIRVAQEYVDVERGVGIGEQCGVHAQGRAPG